MSATRRTSSHRWGRPQARRPNPEGFSFAFTRRGELFALPFRPTLLGRSRCNRQQKSGGPSLFEPSLKVQRDNAHNQNSRFALPPVSTSSTRDLAKPKPDVAWESTQIRARGLLRVEAMWWPGLAGISQPAPKPAPAAFLESRRGRRSTAGTQYFKFGRNDSSWGFLVLSDRRSRSPQAKPPTGQHFAQCPAGGLKRPQMLLALRPFCEPCVAAIVRQLTARTSRTHQRPS